MNYIQEQTTNN